MLILTTIYFTHLKDLDPEGADEKTFLLEPSAAKSRELFRHGFAHLNWPTSLI